MDERHEVPYTEDQTHQSLYETPTPERRDPWEEPPRNPEGFQPELPKQKKRRPAKRFVAAALGCAVLGGAMGLGGGFLGAQLSRESEATNRSTMLEGKRESTVIQTASVDTSQEMTQAEVYAANVNSTVGISTEITTNYWGFQTTAAASGTPNSL